MKYLLLLAVGLWLGLAAQLVSAADWPTYLHDYQRSGFTAQELSHALRLAWVYRAAEKPIMAWSGPRSEPIEGHSMKHRVDFDAAMQVVISQGRVYFGSTVDHRVYCLDAKTGETLWSFYTEGPIRLAPTIAQGLAYVGSDDGRVYCLDAVTGVERWRLQVGPADDRLLSRGKMVSRWPVRTGVLVEDGIAYFGAGVFPHETVYLAAADAQSGKIVWRNDAISQEDAGRNELSPQGYWLTNDDFLYVPSGRSLPVGVKKSTGEILFQRQYSWRSEAGGVVGGVKALFGDGQVYAGGPHHFMAIDGKTGDLGAAWINGRQMVIAEDEAFLLDGLRLFAVRRAEHAQASQERQKWFLIAQQSRSNPELAGRAKKKMEELARTGVIWEYSTSHDGVVIATSNLVFVGGPNEVLALDRKTGQLAWKAAVEGNVKGLSISDSLLTVSTEAGHIYGFTTEPGESQPFDRPAPLVPAFAEQDQTPFYRTAAREILERSGQKTGFCLVLGSADGRLAHELALQSRLQILAVEPDSDAATRVRTALERAGLHGARVTVVNKPLDQLPFANYFANLIVSETQLRTGEFPCSAESVARFLKPCGGVAIFGFPSQHDLRQRSDDESRRVESWLTELYHLDQGELVTTTPWQSLRRGKLPGAGQWTHQYGNVANTSFTADERIRDGLGVLWYGDPGPSAMINRHEGAGAPLSTNGRMFIQGTEQIMAYDAYNGNFLWEYKNPGAIRTGVFNNRETHNLAATDEHLFVAIQDECRVLDTATGDVLRVHRLPTSTDGIQRAWAYVAVDQGQLFGTSTLRRELEEKLRRRGLTVASQTDGLFAIDTVTGQQQWVYRGTNILHTTIALSPDLVFFIDSSLSPEQRQELYRSDKGDLKDLTGEAAKRAEEEIKKLDIRLAVALDRRTGQKVWQHAVDVTDTTNVSAGGGNLTVMYANGHLVLCGANANGHYWKQFLAGEFEKRKLLVLDAKTGEELWTKNANYMNRPAVIGTEIFAEPWAFDLHTGAPKMRPHPLTGEPSEWRFSRPGHHCGVITATPNMMFFRSGFIGYYDLYNDSGTRHFAGQRLGCWINAIPGNGLLMIPEASAGCVCQFSITSTVVLEPKAENKSWGIFSAVGESTPVKRLGINFGAPGDRKDPAGQEWLGYPRPKTVGRLEYVLDLKTELAANGKWFSHNEQSQQFVGTAAPWLFTSGAEGLTHVEFPLLGPDDAPRSYQIKLYFTQTHADDLANMSVKLQGTSYPVQSEPIATATDSGLPALAMTFPAVRVERNLVIDLQYAANRPSPKLAAAELTVVESP